MSKIQSNSERVWKDLRTDLLRYARARVPSKEIAEDITHDVFVKMSRKIAELRDEERLAPWAYRITRNAIADHYRKSANVEQAPLAEASESKSYHNFNYNEQVASWLPRFLEELPEQDRQLLERVELRRIPQKQVAAELDLPYSSVKSKVQRARAKLKQLLENCCRIEFDQRGNVIDYRENNCDC